MTQQELDALKALAAKANLGHLEARLCWPDEDGEPDYCDVQINDIYADSTVATSCYSEDMPLEVSAYIAAACNAVPALVAEVERLTARVKELKRDLAEARKELGRWETDPEGMMND